MIRCRLSEIFVSMFGSVDVFKEINRQWTWTNASAAAAVGKRQEEFMSNHVLRAVMMLG